MTDGDAVEADQLRQWWRSLTPDARSSFSTCLDGPIPAEHLDSVLAGGIRIVGVQRGNAPMVWHFASQAQIFIVNAPEPGAADGIHSLGAS